MDPEEQINEDSLNLLVHILLCLQKFLIYVKFLKSTKKNCEFAKFLFLFYRRENAERLSNYKKLVNFTSAKGMVF